MRLAWVLGLVLLVGCGGEGEGDGSSSTVCDAGRQELCACEDGNQGAQVCLPDGSGWDVCSCASGTGGESSGSGGESSSTGGAVGTGGAVATGGSSSGGSVSSGGAGGTGGGTGGAVGGSPTGGASSGGSSSGGAAATGGAASGGTGGGATCQTEWCKDADNDGYINRGDCIISCVLSGADWPGYNKYRRSDAASGDDCYDGNNKARPGQTQFFDEDRGDGSFDYNCDDDEAPEFGLGSCLQLNVPDKEGWISTVPACGTTGNLVVFDVDGDCDLGGEEATAACR